MSALGRFAKEAARRYLQSAVFVDDHIFDQKTGMPAPAVDLPPQRKRIYKSNAGSDMQDTGLEIQDKSKTSEQPYHPKDLVSSFAKEGITCALYEPPENFATDLESEIYKLCERPDIIILDWDFLGDKGAKALDLISTLVRQSTAEFPHHVRLISIYTADQSLTAVANMIADRLKKNHLEAIPMDAQCRLQSGATRLLVLGKPIARFGDEEVKFTVKESALATKLIDEFVAMNEGILPSYALHGLAAIRNSTKRILEQFHGDLDGAFLTHRELVAESEEAFDQLPELLSEEICAVVEDERLSSGNIKKIAGAALKRDHVSKADKSLIAFIQKEKNQKDGQKKIINKFKESGIVSIGHQHLAALFSSRTQYASGARKLSFGTVVRFRTKHSRLKKTPWCYAVCLVPICDSLRLKKPAAHFPFWTIESETYNSTARRNGLVLAANKGYISLSAGGKAVDKLWIDSFDVDKKTKMVVAPHLNGAYKYTGSTKRTIEWVGQLKPLHAHRIAHVISDGLSRVGVSEAEWLRLLCDRGH